MSAEVSVKSFNTDERLWLSLAQVFEADCRDGTEWVNIYTKEGVKLTFFRCSPANRGEGDDE